MLRAVCCPLAVGADQPFAPVTVANVSPMNVLVALQRFIAIVLIVASGFATAQPASCLGSSQRGK